MSTNNAPDAPGPTIPASVNFQNNFTRVLETDKILCQSLTDGQAVLSGGRLTNLNNPIMPQDAATKYYADTVINTIAGPQDSVQYNYNNNFNGTTNLTYSETTGTIGIFSLYSKNTIIGTGTNLLTISSGYIQNIPVPTTQQTVISKDYVDNFYTLNFFSSASTSVTYSAEQMTNNIITRNISGTNGSDTTASSSDIITHVINTGTYGSLSSGSDFKWSVKNSHTSTSLSITAGTGVMFCPTTSTLNIYPGYEMDSVICANPDTSTTNLLVTSLQYIGSNPSNNNFLMGPRSMFTTANVTRISESYQFDTSITTFYDQNVIYAADNLSGIVHRDFDGPKEDTFGEISAFISSYSSINSPIYYLFTTGAIEVVIKNISTSGSLSLVGSSDWTMDTNSNMTVPIGKAGYFYVYVDVPNVHGYVYTIGIMDI
jgi:hypothetical protein